jgi:archaemetzincin
MLISRRALLAGTLVAGVAAIGLRRWSAGGNDGSSSSTPPLIVRLQPLGPRLADAEVARAAATLREYFGADADVLPVRPLPDIAYYPPRGRYRADRLLDVLAQQPATPGTYLLGLTAVDISWTKGDHADWGVLGLARIGGRVGVVSSYRCGAASVGRDRASERFGKVAAHELGHCLGLAHCASAGCIMRDAESRVATVDDSRLLCPQCRGRVAIPG